MARPHRNIKGFRSRIEPASLASLWQSHGKATEAHDLLAPVYGWFIDGVRQRRPEGDKGTLERTVLIAEVAGPRAIRCLILANIDRETTR